MNLKSALKVLGTVLLLTGMSNEIHAAVLPAPRNDLYLVYSGTVSQADWSGGSTSTATKTQTTTIYVIVDLNNNSSYSLLYIENGEYTIESRILSADGTTLTGVDNGVAISDTNPAHNFINGIENNAKSASTSPTKGYVVLRFSDSEIDTESSHDYPDFTEVYAVGAQAGLSTTAPVTLVAADAKAKVSGVYTINPIAPALTNYFTGTPNYTNSYPTSLSGTIFSYGYDSTLQAAPNPDLSAMSHLNVSGKITLTLNATLTSLANVGGSFKLKGQVTPTIINAVQGPLTTNSSSTIYETFLYQIAKSLNASGNYIPGI